MDQPIEITYRISRNVVGVVYKNEADCAMALELNGTEIIPKSSAKLPSQIIKVELIRTFKWRMRTRTRCDWISESYVKRLHDIPN